MMEKRPSGHVISYFHRSKIETGQELKHFHTDGGKEYNRAERTLESRGVKVTRTPIHTPQWNAIAERKNRTIVEMARACLLHARLDPDVFCQYAVETAVFVHNRVTVVHPYNKTPHELFTGRKPNVSMFRVFGCKAIVRSSDEHPGKFAARGLIGIFVGYDMKRELCYRVWVDGKIIVSRDVRFDEQEFIVAKNNSAVAIAEIQNHIDRCLPSNVAEVKDRVSAEGDPGKEDPDAKMAGEGFPPKSKPYASEDQDSRSHNESEEEEGLKVDKQTMKKIDKQNKSAKSTAAVASVRRSVREKNNVKQSGLNMDDFGKSAFAISSHPTSAPSAIRTSDVSIPGTVRKAMQSKFAAQWKAAMDAEMKSIREHETYFLVDAPDSQINLVTNKWVFAVKEKDGYVIRFKARLVARGFTQQHGVDYEETYSAVARGKSVRAFLAVVAIRDLNLELMDVETAYLNASLKETVYMVQPQGYEQGGKNVVCLLKKALYGLKQSGREWHEHIDAFIQSLGFTRCKSDECVYTRLSRNKHMILIVVYVDDIPGAFDEVDRQEWEEIKQAFADQYKIKFLGDADWFLGMRIRRDRSCKILYLDQQSYAESVLEEFHLDESRSVAHPGTPEELTKAGCATSTEEIAEMRSVPYRQAIGSLMYLANCTRPDMLHAVNLAAQFSQNPGAIHWRAVMQILRYLCGTTELGLKFDGNMGKNSFTHSDASSAQSASVESPLVIYADANWGSCKDSRRSTTGWLIQLGNCWIDWSCHKQATVALSSCEAEYMAVTASTQGAMWMSQLLHEIGFMRWICGGASSPSSTISPVPLIYSDNKSAIAMAQNDSLHSRSKHIDIKHHFIREQIEKKFIQIQWISTHQQVADILTKTLQPRTFIKFRDLLVATWEENHTLAQQQNPTEQPQGQ
jgi:reverse transcriptase-like protein